jgi:hypothetical protein
MAAAAVVADATTIDRFKARLGPRQPMPTNVRADPRARAVRAYTDLDTPAKGAQIDYGFD